MRFDDEELLDSLLEGFNKLDLAFWFKMIVSILGIIFIFIVLGWGMFR